MDDITLRYENKLEGLRKLITLYEGKKIGIWAPSYIIEDLDRPKHSEGVSTYTWASPARAGRRFDVVILVDTQFAMPISIDTSPMRALSPFGTRIDLYIKDRYS